MIKDRVYSNKVTDIELLKDRILVIISNIPREMCHGTKLYSQSLVSVYQSCRGTVGDCLVNSELMILPPVRAALFLFIFFYSSSHSCVNIILTHPVKGKIVAHLQSLQQIEVRTEYVSLSSVMAEKWQQYQSPGDMLCLRLQLLHLKLSYRITF